MDGYPVTYPVSFFMTVAVGGPDGEPEAHGLLVYGQSDLPDSPHHGDQVADWAARRLRPLAFTDDAIAATTIEHRRIGG
jgi:acyl-homoserine lactone acylase PvdQ